MQVGQLQPGLLSEGCRVAGNLLVDELRLVVSSGVAHGVRCNSRNDRANGSSTASSASSSTRIESVNEPLRRNAIPSSPRAKPAAVAGEVLVKSVQDGQRTQQDPLVPAQIPHNPN
jgi:hypothetical protein